MEIDNSKIRINYMVVPNGKCRPRIMLCYKRICYPIGSAFGERFIAENSKKDNYIELLGELFRRIKSHHDEKEKYIGARRHYYILDNLDYNILDGYKKKYKEIEKLQGAKK
jgi:hypothetical protein